MVWRSRFRTAHQGFDGPRRDRCGDYLWGADGGRRNRRPQGDDQDTRMRGAWYHCGNAARRSLPGARSRVSGVYFLWEKKVRGRLASASAPLRLKIVTIIKDLCGWDKPG